MKGLLIAFVFMLGASNCLSAQVFDYIVAKDGSGDFTTVQAAIDACPDNERKLIFIKSGTYEEKVMIGSHSKVSNKLLSIIGEDKETVIITWDDYNGKEVDGKTMGGTECGTFIVNAVDFYAENITIQNTYTKSQAIALYNVADRQTFKNCRIIGYQDTHRLRKGRRYYFKDSYIEGAVDYIYCAGPAIYDDCELRTIKEGGYIVAPEDVPYNKVGADKTYYYCFVFRNCLLTSPDNTEYYLGRPWKTEAAAVFINSKMQGVKKEGWADWGGRSSTAFFAEHNSMDLDGKPLDISNRVDWSYQLTKEEIDTYYTPEIIYSFVSGGGVPYDPFTLVIAPQKPLGLTVSESVITWTAVDNAKGYIIYENDMIIGFSESASFTHVTSSAKTYTVKTVGQNGNLSEAGKVGDTSGISDIESDQTNIFVKDRTLFLPENKKCEVYTLSGTLVKTTNSETEIGLSSYLQGVYLVKVTTVDGNIYSSKINLK